MTLENVSPAAVFDALSGQAKGRAFYEGFLEVVAPPGGRVPTNLQRGDLLIVRGLGEGGCAQLSVIADSNLSERRGLRGDFEGVTAEVIDAIPASGHGSAAPVPQTAHGVRHQGRSTAGALESIPPSDDLDLGEAAPENTQTIHH